MILLWTDVVGLSRCFGPLLATEESIHGFSEWRTFPINLMTTASQLIVYTCRYNIIQTSVPPYVYTALTIFLVENEFYLLCVVSTVAVGVYT